MDSLNELLEDELKDIYSAENQLLKAMPRLSKKATSPALKKAFDTHLKESENQVRRLEKIGETLGIKLKGKVCAAMKGLIEEGKELLTEKGDKTVLDAALIGSAQRVEHYEIAAYGTVVAIAKQLGHDDIAKLLEQTLAEEKKTDDLLTQISVGQILGSAPTDEEEA